MIIVDEFWMASLKNPTAKYKYLCLDEYMCSYHHSCEAGSGLKLASKQEIQKFIEENNLKVEDYEINKYTLCRNN